MSPSWPWPPFPSGARRCRLGLRDKVAERALGGLEVRGERCEEGRQISAGNVGESVAQVGDVRWRDGNTARFAKVERGGVYLIGRFVRAGEGVDEGGSEMGGQGGGGLAGVAVEVAAEVVVAAGYARDVVGQVEVAEGVAYQADGGDPVAAILLDIGEGAENVADHECVVRVPKDGQAV